MWRKKTSSSKYLRSLNSRPKLELIILLLNITFNKKFEDLILTFYIWVLNTTIEGIVKIETTFFYLIRAFDIPPPQKKKYILWPSSISMSPLPRIITWKRASTFLWRGHIKSSPLWRLKSIVKNYFSYVIICPPILAHHANKASSKV